MANEVVSAIVRTDCENEAILQITDGTDAGTIDLLGVDSGWQLEDPYWNPQITQPKGGGVFADSAIADGRRLVFARKAHVVETIPLSVRGRSIDQAIATIRKLLRITQRIEDYWGQQYEYSDFWLEVRPKGLNTRTGYSRISIASIAELTNPFGQPFYSSERQAVMDGLVLIVEREPYWRGLPPGTIIGPLFNLLKNPDFEGWNTGIADSQPDNWDNLESLWITGTNNQESTIPHSGSFALQVRVSGSTLTGASKGVTQVVSGVVAETTYTVVAWVRNAGVSNGVGRILVTFGDQFELYRDDSVHDWTLFVGKFDTGTITSVGFNCEILTTAANTDGTVYFDSLMLLEGDWTTEAANQLLPYMTSSHVRNHWDQPGKKVASTGHINFVDAWNVPGDVDALIRLVVQNSTTPADSSDVVEVIKKLRIGQRRTQNVLNFQNFFDPDGVEDTTAAGDDRVTVAQVSGWAPILSQVISESANTADNQGRFRVLVRVWDTRATANMQARLRYFVGVEGVSDKTLDAFDAPISGNWTMIDLTQVAAMIQDQKFASIPLNQVGFIVEAQRPAGNDEGRFDYVLTMPTDGGYLEMTINPPIQEGDSATIDNTGSQTISGTFSRTGWNQLVDLGGTEGFDFEIFHGKVFACQRDGQTGRVFRQDGIAWTQVLSVANSPFQSLKEFNGQLYAIPPEGASVRRSPDGVTWDTVFSLTSGSLSALGAVVFDGKLWMATGGTNASPPAVFHYDGTTLTTSITFPVAIAGLLTGLTEYKGKLYTMGSGATPAGIYEYNPDTDAWTNVFDPSPLIARNSIEFQGRLHAFVNTAPGTHYTFDGEAWETLASVGSALGDLMPLAVFDGGLYVTRGATGAVLVSSDGETFEDVYNPAGFLVEALVPLSGILYMMTVTEIHALANEDLQFSVSDYKGTTFTAPPETRHRWVFSYDRDGDINAIDDQALIGIGYVPRYLSLRGDG
ncbi:MAG: hypothetical protein ACYTEQ_09385 [Planctomycetota bacterium]|jgi:hypothetical protein